MRSVAHGALLIAPEPIGGGMKKFVKWLGVIVGALLVIALVGYFLVYFTTNNRINRVYAVATTAITVPSDAETIAYGERLGTMFGCNGCHGENLEGAPLIEAPVMGMVYAPNLTTGEGGVLNEYTDAELARAIRHGVDREGHPLLIMPSTDFVHLSDEDTAAIIGYLRAAPPVDSVQPASELGSLGRVLLALNVFPAFPAEEIDHAIVRSAAPERGATIEYGKYLAAACQGCHRPNFAGGPPLGGGPDDVKIANLTPAGELATWSTDDFITTMRTGVTPAGHQLDAEMPWQAYANLGDDELTAIFLFLQSLPAAEPAG